MKWTEVRPMRAWEPRDVVPRTWGSLGLPWAPCFFSAFSLLRHTAKLLSLPFLYFQKTPTHSLKCFPVLIALWYSAERAVDPRDS